jgi:hypothetical protein
MKITVKACQYYAAASKEIDYLKYSDELRDLSLSASHSRIKRDRGLSRSFFDPSFCFATFLSGTTFRRGIQATPSDCRASSGAL